MHLQWFSEEDRDLLLAAGSAGAGWVRVSIGVDIVKGHGELIDANKETGEPTHFEPLSLFAMVQKIRISETPPKKNPKLSKDDKEFMTFWIPLRIIGGMLDENPELAAFPKDEPQAATANDGNEI